MYDQIVNPPLYIVDAFTDKPFHGNSAAVILCDTPIEEHLLQAIAMEMNLPETAYVLPITEGVYGLRWFTPTTEVKLCGHATLASAHALFEHGYQSDLISFDTLSGRLTARRHETKIELDFPAEAATPADLPYALNQALWTGKNRLAWFAQLPSEADVRAFTLDPQEIPKLGHNGLIITAVADDNKEYDFVSRCFYPNLGIPEDPVTGSAHCALAPFWTERLNRTPLTGHQASPRGGLVEVELSNNRILLRGHAITTVRGNLVA